MNKLTSFEKLQADEVLKLELAYSNLYQAYVLGDTEEMKNRYVAAMDINIPFLANSVYSKTMQIMQQNKILPKFEDIRNINDGTILRMNIKGCLDALQEEMNIRNIYQNHYIYAQSILFQPNRIFTQDEVLYQDSQGQQLRVADLLKVSKYAISIAEAIAPENKKFTTANAAITTFQGIDAILNNKAEDKPINKMLHLATSFLSSVVKSTIKDDDTKRAIIIPTIMVDLAIDFFVKK